MLCLYNTIFRFNITFSWKYIELKAGKSRISAPKKKKIKLKIAVGGD